MSSAGIALGDIVAVIGDHGAQTGADGSELTPRGGDAGYAGLLCAGQPLSLENDVSCTGSLRFGMVEGVSI